MVASQVENLCGSKHIFTQSSFLYISKCVWNIAFATFKYIHMVHTEAPELYCNIYNPVTDLVKSKTEIRVCPKTCSTSFNITPNFIPSMYWTGGILQQSFRRALGIGMGPLKKNIDFQCVWDGDEGPLVIESSFSSATHVERHYVLMHVFVITRNLGQQLVSLHEVPCLQYNRYIFCMAFEWLFLAIDKSNLFLNNFQVLC